ncbi:putative protein N(5)-glutamine methyltransferase [soil metagenome]
MPLSSEIVERLRAAGCVFAEEEAALLIAEASSTDALEEFVSRRVGGEPLEYILGWAEFGGRRYFVDPGTFVPRHRTEFLVALAVALTRKDSTVLDLCCGTGALGAAVLEAVPSVQLWSSDIDARAARRNLDPTRVFEGDLFDPLPGELRGSVDVLLCNTPYVPSSEIDLLPREARLYERRETLDGGADGLDLQRRVAAEAGEWLAPGGHVLFEVAEGQADASKSILEQNGFNAHLEYDDDSDTTVVVGGRWHRIT